MPLYFFLHVPKTAGTTLKQVWRRMFGEFFFVFNPAIHRVPQGRPGIWDEPGFYDRYLMIGGHAGIGHPIVRKARRSQRRSLLIGVMRDPARRVASHYDFVRKRPEHPMHAELRDRTLLQAMEHHGVFRREAVNAQLRQLFGSDEPAAVEAALRTNNFIIGRQDRLDEFIDTVSVVSGLPRPPKIGNANTAAQPGPVAAEPAKSQATYDSAMNLLAELNRAESAFMEAHLSPVLVTTSVQASEHRSALNAA